jgi:hypothetical protein
MLRMSEKLFSTGAVAALIMRDDADQTAIIERLKTFTTDGLIQQHGALNPGRGMMRKYSDGMVCVAAVLNALADFNIIVRREPFAGFWSFVGDEVQTARLVWLKAKGQGDFPPTMYLELADAGKVDQFGRRFFVYVHGIPKRLAHHGRIIAPISWGSHVLPLSRMFEQIDRRMAALAKDE